MARYVSLIRFTGQGARALGFRKAAEKAGITVESQLWTVGYHDGVPILSGDEKEDSSLSDSTRRPGQCPHGRGCDIVG